MQSLSFQGFSVADLAKSLGRPDLPEVLIQAGVPLPTIGGVQVITEEDWHSYLGTVIPTPGAGDGVDEGSATAWRQTYPKCVPLHDALIQCFKTQIPGLKPRYNASTTTLLLPGKPGKVGVWPAATNMTLHAWRKNQHHHFLVESEQDFPAAVAWVNGLP